MMIKNLFVFSLIQGIKNRRYDIVKNILSTPRNILSTAVLIIFSSILYISFPDIFKAISAATILAVGIYTITAHIEKVKIEKYKLFTDMTYKVLTRKNVDNSLMMVSVLVAICNQDKDLEKYFMEFTDGLWEQDQIDRQNKESTPC